MRLGISGLEIVPQSFALLAKREFEEVDEAVCDLAVPVKTEFVLSWRHGKPQGGGMHFGRRGKGAGREGEEFFDASVELGGGGEQTVVAAAGFGGDAIGNLALYQDDEGFKIFGVIEEAQQNIGSDVVRKIADHSCAA